MEGEREEGGREGVRLEGRREWDVGGASSLVKVDATLGGAILCVKVDAATIIAMIRGYHKV